MSTIKVNTVTKRTGSTLTLGESGTTVTLACGAFTKQVDLVEQEQLTGVQLQKLHLLQQKW